jgi:hypothetical protein
MKNQILNLIENQKSENLKITDEYFGDNISKLDWSSAEDFSRPWTQFFGKRFQETLDEISQECGYQTALVTQLWFQQYHQNDVHGWHVHGSNFTGVYYVELPEDSPKTELINPFTQQNLIIPEIQEGDFLIFPSFTIHRAPKVYTKSRKTIISWNCDFDMVRPDLLNTFDQL